MNQFISALKQFFERFLSNWRLVVSITLLTVLLVVSLGLRFNYISCALPYPGKYDEGLVTNGAKRVLAEGDFNTRYLAYPSLPAYLTAAGFTLGYISAVSNLDFTNTNEIGSIAYPYYSHVRFVWPAKALFALFSVLSLLTLGIIGYRLTKDPIVLFVGPLLLALSSIYFHYSCHYINVDILGVFFVLLLFAYLVYNFSDDSLLHKAIFPGMLCGLVISAKYHLVWIFIPCILTIWLFGKRQRLLKSALLLPVMFLTFFVINPYVILDFKGFLNSLSIILVDYNRGRAYLTATPGVEVFLVLINKILTDFGHWTAVFAVIGLFSSLTKDFKKTVVLLSFPLVLLYYTSNMSAYAVRNVLVVFAFYSLFFAIGVAVVYRFARDFLCGLSLSQQLKKFIPLITLATLFLLGLVMVPIENMVKIAKQQPDARVLSVDWIKQNVEKGSTLIIPTELSFKKVGLEKKYNIVEFTMKNLDEKTFYNQLPSFSNPHMIMPLFCYDGAHHLTNKSSIKLTYRLNNFFNYLDIRKTFPGNYRIGSYWSPFTRMSLLKQSDFYQAEGKYVTGCTYVDKRKNFPCIPDGFPELAIGRLAIPVDRKIELTPPLMQVSSISQGDNTLIISNTKSLQSLPLIFKRGKYELLVENLPANLSETAFKLNVKTDDNNILSTLTISNEQVQHKIPLQFEEEKTVRIVLEAQENTSGARHEKQQNLLLKPIVLSPLTNDASLLRSTRQDYMVIEKELSNLAVENILSTKTVENGLQLIAQNEDPFILLPPIEPTREYPPLIVEVVITSSVDTDIAVYFLNRPEQRYSERRKVVRRLHKGHNSITFTLPPEQVAGQLRLDPGTLAGTYTIHKISVGKDHVRYSSFFDHPEALE